MKVLITDSDFPSLELEREVFREAGLELVAARCRSPEEVIRAGQDAQALLVQYAPITQEVLEALPRLRIVSRYGVGVDTIDLTAAQERGVWVANVPDYGTEEVAAHAFAMMMALVRHLVFFDRAVRRGRWHYLETGALRRPSALTAGIVGLGRIGRTVAGRAQLWFGRVVGYDPYLLEESWPQGITRLELEDVFASSHVVSLHLPLSPDTRGLVGRELLARMPEGSYLVNTARGGLIDLEALHWALEEGRLEGAALDVLPQEPPPQDHPLLRHPRVLLSPHAAFYSREAEEELRRKAVLNIVSWASEGRPLYTVVEGRGGQTR